MSMEFKNMEVPEKLDEVVNNSMKQIYEEERIKRKKAWITKGCSAAAVLACGIMVGVANPSFAGNLPLVGHIFETMQDKFSYQGDYNGIGEVLEENSNTEDSQSENVETQYTQTVDGVTVTLSEIYCNKQAIYLSMEIHSEEAFPDMYEPTLYTSENYSFNSADLGDSLSLNGELVDANTYAGLIRFDLNDKLMDDSDWAKAIEEAQSDDDLDLLNLNYENYIKKVELPETFTLDLSIDKIMGDLKNPPKADYGISNEELEQMSDEEWHDFMTKWDNEHPDFYDSQSVIYNGPWTFSLEITTNTQDTQVVDLTDRVENGIGFSTITKDRFEISVCGLNNNPQDMGTYFPVLLDADGRLMDYGDGGSVCTVAINDSDVSSVDLFLIDETLWLDNLKGEWRKTPNGLTDPEEIKEFKELLEEQCAYHTEVQFE